MVGGNAVKWVTDSGSRHSLSWDVPKRTEAESNTFAIWSGCLHIHSTAWLHSVS